MNVTYPFCHSAIFQFGIYYSLHVHTYLSSGICIFGTIANSLNILTLSRKDMVSPVNAVLLVLSIIDLLLLLMYIPYALEGHVKIFYKLFTGRNTFTCILHMLLHAIGCCILHGISIWLTVLIAIYRYMVVVHPFKNGIWNSTKRTYIAVATVCFVNLSFIAPLYLSVSIQPIKAMVAERGQITNATSVDTNVTYYTTTFAFYDTGSVMQYWFSIYNTVTYLLPSVLQIFLISKLVFILLNAQKIRKQMCSAQTVIEKQTHQTNKMLLVVLILYLFAEVPYGLSNLALAYLDEQFLLDCYLSISGVMDILLLFNISSTFLVYYNMSHKFRSTLKSLCNLNKTVKPITSNLEKTTIEENF